MLNKIIYSIMSGDYPKDNAPRYSHKKLRISIEKHLLFAAAGGFQLGAFPVCLRTRNDEEGQGSADFFQVSPSRCADFKFFSNTDIANLSGLTAAEVGFLAVKPFKKHSTNRGQTGNAPLPTSPNLRCFQGVEAKKYVCPSSLASSTNLRAA